MENVFKGLYRPTLIMRQNEAIHAIREARKLSWVDSDNIVLMGLSQGGIATATFSGEPVKAFLKQHILQKEY